MKKLAFLLSFCLAANALWAQDPASLSLETLDSLSKHYYKTAKYDKAIIYGEEHLKRVRKMNNDTLLAHSLTTLGMSYEIGMPYETAVKLFSEALDIRKRVYNESHSLYINSLYHLGSAYRMVGFTEQAENLLLQAKKFTETHLSTETADYNDIVSVLAIVYGNMGKADLAVPLYEQAVELSAKRNGGTPSPNPLQNLASAYQAVGRYTEAEKLNLRVMKMKAAMEGEWTPGYGLNLSHMAGLYLKMGRFDESEKLYLRVFDIWMKSLGETHLGPPLAQENLGKFYLQTKRYDEAEKAFYYAIFLNAEEKKDSSLLNGIEHIREYTFRGSYRLMEVLIALQRLNTQRYKETQDKKYLQKAYDVSTAALYFNEMRRSSFTQEGDKLRLLGRTSQLVEMAMHTGFSLDANAYKEELWGFSELNKSILLMEAAKSERAKTMSNLPDSLVQQESQLQEELARLKKQEAESGAGADVEKIKAEINKIGIEINKFTEKIKSDFPKYYNLKYAQHSTKVADVQALLDEQTLFLEYSVADSSTYLFALSKKDLQLFSLKLHKDSLKTAIKSLRRQLTDYQSIANDAETAYSEYTRIAFWFYQTLLAPALDKQADGIKKLIIVTDGELGHLPFEVFLRTKAPEQGSYNDLHYLIKDFSISYNYSAELWKDNYTSQKKSNNGQFFAFAASYGEGGKATANRSPDILDLRNALGELPAAKQEVEALSALFSGDFRVGADANEAYFKSKASEYGIIHLAMHGLLNKKQPILSSLAFTENGDSTEDNFLEAWEIAHLELNADLVVLSACETGYGKFQQGEGVMSLARSFMYAGVPALVVSMWEVNDASTSKMMQIFYDNLAAGQDKAEALRQAKLQYLSESKGLAGHPAYWSPFVQIGDARPVSLAGQSRKWWWIGGGAAAAILLLAVLAMRKKR